MPTSTETDRKPTPAAKRFIEANRGSPVVSGAAKSEGGAYYRLKNGSRFNLSLEDCRSMPHPRWLGEEADPIMTGKTVLEVGRG